MTMSMSKVEKNKGLLRLVAPRSGSHFSAVTEMDWKACSETTWVHKLEAQMPETSDLSIYTPKNEREPCGFWLPVT